MNKFINIFFMLTLSFFIVISNYGYAFENLDEINSLYDDFLYKFDKLNENGDVLYDKKSPIIVDGKKIRLKKIYDSNKEMFRGTWIATISNINFPKEKGCSFDELVKEFNVILDRVEKLNLNAIFFQVSPELDAFYESKFRPWSKYLTGDQGVEPLYYKEGKDFLKYAINETRRRGIEFHAWFNPYRVTKDPYLNKTKDQIIGMLSENNFARQNSNLVYLFSGKLFLDPGRQEVVDFIKNTVHEFISKYDVDGIHFDDYFYPYGSQNIKGTNYKFGDMKEDFESFQINSRGISDINDWRRDNVNILIKEVKSIISHYNYMNEKSIQWGVSPFGIYAHKGEEIKNGSKTGNLLNGSNTPYGSLSSYRDIYADTLYWIDNELIDYVIPQIYWTFGKKEAPYEELVNFWSGAVRDKRCQLYIGHGNYSIREVRGDSSWNNPYEITNQIKFNSNYDNVFGSVFFSVEDLYESLEEGNSRSSVYEKYIKSLENDILNCKSLIPSKPWLDFKNTSEIFDLRILNGDDKYYLFFKDKIGNDSKFYVVYGFKDENHINYDDSKNILGVYGRDYSKEFQSIVLNNLPNDIKCFVITIKDFSGAETKGVKHVFKI